MLSLKEELARSLAAKDVNGAFGVDEDLWDESITFDEQIMYCNLADDIIYLVTEHLGRW